MTKGAILVLNDVPKDVKREAIKELFNKYGTCSWVDMDSETGEVGSTRRKKNIILNKMLNCISRGSVCDYVIRIIYLDAKIS